MLLLIIAIALPILSLLVAFIPTGALICYGLLFLIALGSAGACIYFVVEKKGKALNEIISLIILVLFVLFSYRCFSLVRNYYKVRQELNKEFGEVYRIVGVTNKGFYNCYNKYNYAYKVKLYDNTNITFYAASGTGGIPIPSDNVCYDYANYYIPYYLDLFNEQHQSNLSYKIKPGEEDDDIIYMEYSNKNKKLLYEFIEYLYSKDFDAHYQINIYNTDTKEEGYVSSWNDNYKDFIRLEDYDY